MNLQLKNICIIVLSVHYVQSSDILKNLKAIDLQKRKINLFTQALKNPDILKNSQFEKEVFWIQEYDDDDDEWYLKHKCTKKEIKENIKSCIQDHTQLTEEYRQTILKNPKVQKNLHQNFPGLHKGTPSKFLYPQEQNDFNNKKIIKNCVNCLALLIFIKVIVNSQLEK